MASIPDPKDQFQAYQESLFKALVSATNACNALPSEEIGFLRSLDRQFAKDLDSCGSRLLTEANALTRLCSNDTGAEFSRIDDVDDASFRFGSVVDVVDSLLEKADMYLDEMSGRSRNKDDLKQEQPEVTQISTKAKQGRLEYKLLHANNIVRPQLKFKDRVDNSNKTPFIRKIKVKPHAMVPLDYGVTSDMLNEPFGDNTVPQSLPHPYEYEISHLSYPDFMLEESEPIMYEPFDTTSAIWVDNDEQLEKMMQDLATAREIAIDLEHHNYRSYQGFTCLMQISTREQDYIVDTLELRDRLWQLNEYFADPNKVKVLHGAESDIIWLQRDFGIYIVNMFDTYFATKLLEFPQHSLAFLLKKYCSVDADKKYQLADWRIRPLPEEMLKYARSDTHYLLYIYDCVRNELLQRSAANANVLRAALQRSNELAATKHEKLVYDAEEGTGPFGWKNLLAKWRHPMTEQQMSVFKALHRWRDVTAREEDESLNYVVPNHMLFALVERMPTDSAGVIGCCNPCPPLIRMNAQALGVLIQRSKLDIRMDNSSSADAIMSSTVEAKPRQQEQRQESGPSSKPRLPVERKLDPAEFDVTKVQQSRFEQASKISKPSSRLFGFTTMETDEEEQEQALAQKIRASLKLTLPFEGLKVKAVTAAKQELVEATGSRRVTESIAAAAAEAIVPPVKQQEEDELLYIPPAERETKKRRDMMAGDAIVLKDTMRKKNKPSKKKGKKAEQ